MNVNMGDHSESIYNIIPPNVVPLPKAAMYRSKHDPTLPPSVSTWHRQDSTYPAVSNLEGNATKKVVDDGHHATFGKALGSHTADPGMFMKKMAKTSTVPSLAEVRKKNPEQLRPAHSQPPSSIKVPRNDKPVMNLVTSKNFIVSNAVEAILAEPKKVSKESKEYLRKADYGKVPKYLANVKKDIASEYEYINSLRGQECDYNQPIRPLGEEERLELIRGLKQKWESVNFDYQSETHITIMDSVGKRYRRECNEAKMQEIEKDIEKLNRKGIQVDLNS